MVAKDNASAAISLAKALELKPDYLDADNALISLNLQAKNYDQAEKIARDVEHKFPKSPLGLYMQGDILMARKNYGQAVTVLQRAQKMAPSTEGIMKLHGAMSINGSAKRADALLMQWIKAHPNDLLARRYMAEAMAKEGRADAAIEQFQIVLKSDPNDLESLNNLALLYQQTKNPLAGQIAQQAYKLSPDNPMVMDTLGWILVQNGDEKRGLDLLKKAASMLSNVPEIHYHYAVVLAKTGDKQRARQELQSALNSGKSFPGKAEAQVLLGQL
jgi:putative PEP-CTERM system TPR-repeat lipoprotein